MIEFNKRNARIWSIMGINPAIWSIGFDEVAENSDVNAVITADLARFSGLERISKKYPERFYNVGIAEQNMIGVAAGMAMEGIQSYVTTYAPFVTLRCADQVRHLMGNMNLNIKAIGSAAGLTSGWSGTALLAINDIAFMRSIPNMVVLNPADCMEAVKMIIAMSKTSKPTYMRFCGSVNIPIVYQDDYEFEIGKAIVLKKGEKIALIASGTTMVSEAMKAAIIIEEETGIAPSVVNMHTIKPLDTMCIQNLIDNHNIIVTIEEHNIIGGLGSAVSEYLVTKINRPKQISVGIADCNYKLGSRQFMLEDAGLTCNAIAKKIISELNDAL